ETLRYLATGLLDSRRTQMEVALIQRALWRPLEQAFARARLNATVELAAQSWDLSSKQTSPRKTGAPDPSPSGCSDRAVPGFKVLSDNYRRVSLRGKEFNLSKLPAKIVRVLHIELKKGRSGLLITQEINEKIGRNGKARISWAFRKVQDWQELIFQEGKGS